MQNEDLEASLVLYLCLEDIGVKKLQKAYGSSPRDVQVQQLVLHWNINSYCCLQLY